MDIYTYDELIVKQSNQRKTFVIVLHNTQNEYALGLQLISFAERGELNTAAISTALENGIDAVFTMNPIQYERPKELILRALAEAKRNAAKENSLDLVVNVVNEQIKRGNELQYLFLVKMATQLSDSNFDDAENIDIVNLQYLLTAWQPFAGKLFFYLDNDGYNHNIVRSGYHKLSQYLYLATCYGKAKGISFSDAVYACYYDTKDDTRQIQRLQVNSIHLSNLKKFVPILYIDKQFKLIFSKNVKNFAKELMLGKQTTEKESVAEQAFIGICHSYYDQSKNNYDKDLTLEEFIDRYGDMSLLAFYIYCVFRFYSLEHELKTPDTNPFVWQTLISDVQDYASGIKELLDNVVRHSDLHSGYLGIRIHSSNKISGLQKRCADYFNNNTCAGNRDVQSEKYYLEVCITDSFMPQEIRDDIIPDCIMVRKFVENLNNRSELYKEDAKKTVEKFVEKFRTASIKAFFDPGPRGNENGFGIEDWDDYYSIAENVLQHYGLMQFTSIVKSRNGYFMVRSGSSFHDNGECFYSTSAIDSNKNSTKQFFIPGTQYTIVLPISRNPEQYTTGFSAPSRELEFDKIKELRQVDSPWQGNDWAEFAPNYLNDNDAMCTASREAYQKLQKWFSNEKNTVDVDDTYLPVFCFNWSNTNEDCREAFLKGLFYYIDATKDRKEHLRIAIYNCSFAALLQCSELFLAFYNRYSEQKAMRLVDIYLVQKDFRDDFLISGDNLRRAAALSEHTAFSKGRFTLLHTLFSTRIWNRHDEVRTDESSQSDESLRYIPYDLLVKVDGIETVFEKAVRLTLEADIQNQDFGCRVAESHVRVGSKIHITGNFYEAQELFHTPYYLQRFSYIIASAIFDSLQKENRHGEIVLVGYGTYSELLIIAVERHLNEMLKSTHEVVKERIIYENGNGRDRAFLRGLEKNEDVLDKDSKIVLIVPINSTLSTHNKVWAKLKTHRHFENVNNPAYNMAVILIRNGKDAELVGIEKEFWTGIDLEAKTVSTVLISPSVNYLITVSSTWEDPLKCKHCYPEPGHYIQETPIIETNKASVIPAQLIGLKERIAYPATNAVIQKSPFDKEKNKKRITFENFIGEPGSFETSALRYGHIECKGNHFQYFFNTEALLKNILCQQKSKEDLYEWFGTVREHLNPTIEKRDGNDERRFIAEYHILVIPEHKRNALWSDEVISKVFCNEPYVLRFNIPREYRDNVKTKFSNITTLYWNLRAANKKAMIKFHFVDCTISSGRTFRRAQTLMRSLLPEDAFQPYNLVQVSLFESIILILNRVSPDTQKGYIENNNFFSYINLSVPQVRNHEDACVLCNLEKRCQALSKRAATNEIAERWSKKAIRHQVEQIDRLEQEDTEFILRLRQRNEFPLSERAELDDEVDYRAKRMALSFRRLICAQTVYTEIDALGVKRNDTDAVEEKLWDILDQMIRENKKTLDQGEFIISYAKVLSRPFLIFRKSIFEASFRIRLKLLSVLLTKNIPEAAPNGLVRCAKIFEVLSQKTTSKKTNETKYNVLLALLKTLAGSMAKNSSNVVIRKECYSLLFSFFENACLPLQPENSEKKRKEFEDWYLNTIKRLIDSSGDETKSLWLEKLMVTGSEWKEAMEDAAFKAVYGIDSTFGSRVYMENTRILFDGIRDLHNNRSQVEVGDFLNSWPPYYLKNFVRFVNGSYAGDFKENESNTSIRLTQVPNARNEIEAMKSLYELLEASPCSGTEDFYKNLVKKAASASGAAQVLMYGVVEHSDPFCYVKKLLTDKVNQMFSEKGWTVSQQEEGFDHLLKEQPYHSLYEIVPSKSSYKKETGEEMDYLDRLKKIVNWTDTGLHQGQEKQTFWIEADIKTAVIHLVAPDDGIHPVFLLLDYNNVDEKDPLNLRRIMLRGVRNILTFRYMLMECFKQDFVNDLMPNYMQAKVNMGRLSRKHGWGHTSDRKLDFQMDHFDNANSIDPAHTFGQVMQAYADQVCGHLYLQYAQQQELPLYSNLRNLNQRNSSSSQKVEPGFPFSKLKQLDGREVLEMSDVHGLGIKIRVKFKFVDSADNYDSVKIRGKENRIIPILFLLANNTMKYGAPSEIDENENCVTNYLNIRPEGTDLIVSNPMKHESLSVLQEAYISKAKKRLNTPPVGDESISLWTINQYMKDVIAQHEWEAFENQSAVAKSPHALLQSANRLIQQLQSLQKTCARVEITYIGGKPEYDEHGFVANAVFSIRFPILFSAQDL